MYKKAWYVQSCCFTNQTYCFFDVLGAVAVVVAKAPWLKTGDWGQREESVGDPSMNFFFFGGGVDVKGTPGSKGVISLSFPRTLPNAHLTGNGDPHRFPPLYGNRSLFSILLYFNNENIFQVKIWPISYPVWMTRKHRKGDLRSNNPEHSLGKPAPGPH